MSNGMSINEIIEDLSELDATQIKARCRREHKIKIVVSLLFD
jgi:uncharacterized protein (DUF433 family)